MDEQKAIAQGMFYVFHGEDEHSKREYLDKLRSKLGDPSLTELNTNRLSGQSLTFRRLRHTCDSIPFLTERRLVIIEDLLSSQPDYMDSLLDYVQILPSTTRLVFCESRRLPKSHPMISLASQTKIGFVKEFNKLEGRGLQSWIHNRVRSGGGRISPKAAHLLAINIGSDLSLLSNEIEKLLLYKGENEIVDEDVSLLCPYVAESSIFELVDALGSRHGRTSAELLHGKLAEGAAPERLFSMIIRQFRLLIQVKELAAGGHKPPEIAARLGVHNFVAGKLYQQCQNYDMDQLERVYAHLLSLDIDVKLSKTELETGLKVLVAGLVS